MRIAHILNVTQIDESHRARYLHIAQPMTLKSMVIAQRMASESFHVELFAVKHRHEKVDVPAPFQWADDLQTYAWEHVDALHNVAPRRPLPRLVDIVRSLYDVSDAEYFVYTNLDIGLCPHFYLAVHEILRTECDACCINRQDLPTDYCGVTLDVDHIELAFTVEGKPHPGIDCFVFKRDAVPKLELGNVYVGYPPVGQVLKTQIKRNSRDFKWVNDRRLTFHIGRDQAWKNRGDPYWAVNMAEAKGLYVFEKASPK